MELYADPITVNCKKVLSAFELMGIPYKLKKVDYFKAEQKSAEYMAINPMASLPALKDGDMVLWESNSIMQYAADKYGKSDFYPTDLKKRADINRWLFWESNSWFPSCYVFLVDNCVKPLLGGAPDQSVLDKEEPNFHRLAAILDARLAKTDWLCGDSPTLADIAVASPMHLRNWQKLPLAQHKHLHKWMTQKVEHLPAWQKTMVYEGFALQKPAA
jgi:glutathione S-transferase